MLLHKKYKRIKKSNREVVTCWVKVGKNRDIEAGK